MSFLSRRQLSKLQIEQRFEIANKWANSAAEVAERTGNHEAHGLVELLKTNGGIGVPMPGNMMHDFYSGPPDPEIDYIYLCPLLPKDSRRLPADDNRQGLMTEQPDVVARFAEGSRGIYLTPKKLSKLGKGVVLLHELKHAKIDLEGGHDQASLEDVSLEEADILVFEFELLENILGQTYSDIVRQRVSEVTVAPDETLALDAGESSLDRLIVETFTPEDHELDLWLGMSAMHTFWLYYQEHSSDPMGAFASSIQNHSNDSQMPK